MRFTLLTDGSSDRALIPILTWAFRQAGVASDLQPQWADFRNLRRPPIGLTNRISTAVDLYPCELLFIHRDAEQEPLEVRFHEIRAAIGKLRESGFRLPYVCVIPIRMQETWLLINVQAIRTASGNPNGTVQIHLPHLQNLENQAAPKELLFDLLRTASELNARRLRKLNVFVGRQRVAELIDDFSTLRALSAFNELETELRRVIAENGWE